MKYFLSLFIIIFLSGLVFGQHRFIRRADRALEKGHVEKARRHIDKATQNRKTENSPKAWLLKGHVYRSLALDSTRFSELEFLTQQAVIAYRKSDSLSQSDELHTLYVQQSLEKFYHQVMHQAISNTESRKYAKTKKYLAMARKILPDQPGAYLFGGQLGMAWEDYGFAKENFDYLIHQIQYRGAGLRKILDNMISIQLIRKAPLDSTLSYFHLAEQLLPDSNNLLEREVALLINAGRLSMAEKKLNAGVGVFPENSYSLLSEEIAEAYYRQNEFSKAITWYQKRLDAQPEDINLLLKLARSHQQLAQKLTRHRQHVESTSQEAGHHLEAALNYLDSAREVSPTDPITKKNIKMVEVELNKLIKAGN